LIGGSIARRARERGARVLAFEPAPTARAYALERGLIDAAVESLEALVAHAEVVVLAAPLDKIVTQLGALRSAAERLPWPALLLDVASVKVPVRDAGRGLAGFVPSHPLAGAERSGPAASRADLFEGAVWTYEPGTGASEAAIRDFIASMGAVPLPLEAEAHDRIVATTSHLPQALSVALGQLLASTVDDPTVARLCGPGIRSMLRLARSDWPLWEPVFAANAGPVGGSLRAFARLCEAIADGLEAHDTQPLREAFDGAARTVRALDEPT
jgi:prephenate dehydrogenase